MELICVRHGRTAWNALGRFQGQTDIPLDDEGLAQAQALAVHLRDEHFDLAVTSDLRRARATAEAICRGRDIAPEATPELREMRFGAWEGLTWDEIVRRWPELDTADEKSPRRYTAEGGEAWEAVCARIGAFLHRIAARLDPAGRALIVCHAGVLHAIVHNVTQTGDGATGAAGRGIKFVPGGILRVRGSFADGWTLTAINETAGAPAPAPAPAPSV
jgi:broad specificity phosphatase PhoE